MPQSTSGTAHRNEKLASWLNDDSSTLWIEPGGGFERRRGHFPPLEGLLFSLALNGFETYDVALCVRFFHSFAKVGFVTQNHFATGVASHPLCCSRSSIARCVVPETHPGVASYELEKFVSPINLQLLQPWLDRLASNDDPRSLIYEVYPCVERALEALDVDALRILLNYLPDDLKGHADREKGQALLASAIREQHEQKKILTTSLAVVVEIVDKLLVAVPQRRDANKISYTSLVRCIKILCSAYDLPPIFLEGAVVGAVRFDSFDVFKTLIECGVGPRSVTDWNTTVNDFLVHFFSASNTVMFGRSFPTKVNGTFRSHRLMSFVEIVISASRIDAVLTMEDRESIVIECIFSILKRNSGVGYDVSRAIAMLLRHVTTFDPTHIPGEYWWWQFAAAGGVQTLKVLDPYLSPKPTAAVVARAVFYAFHRNRRGSGADGSPNDASTVIQDTLEYLLEYSPDAVRDYDVLEETLPGLPCLIQYSTMELALHTKEGTTLVPFLLSHGAFPSNAEGVYSCYKKLSGSLDEFRTILNHPNTLTVLRNHADTIMNKALKLGLNEPPFVRILLELGADPTATVDSEPLVVSATKIGRSALRALSNDGTVKFPPADLEEALEAATRLGKTTTICYLCHVLGTCICDDEQSRAVSPMDEACSIDGYGDYYGEDYDYYDGYSS